MGVPPSRASGGAPEDILLLFTVSRYRHLFTGAQFGEGAAAAGMVGTRMFNSPSDFTLAAAGIVRTRLFDSPTRPSSKKSATGSARGESLPAEAIQNRNRVSGTEQDERLGVFLWCSVVCAVLMHFTVASLTGPPAVNDRVMHASEVFNSPVASRAGWGGHGNEAVATGKKGYKPKEQDLQSYQKSLASISTAAAAKKEEKDKAGAPRLRRRTAAKKTQVRILCDARAVCGARVCVCVS